jgi:DNA-directed RNA polymerase
MELQAIQNWPQAIVAAVGIVALAITLICVFCVMSDTKFPWQK